MPRPGRILVLCSLLAASRLTADDGAKPTRPGESRVDALGDPLPPAALLRMGTTRLRHPDDVGELGLSPDGKTVVTMGRDWLIAWDAESGREKWRHAGDTVQSHSAGAGYGQRLLAFSADSRSVYLPRQDGDIGRCELATGEYAVIDVQKAEPPFAAPGDHGARSVDVAPDGATLATGSFFGATVAGLDGVVRFHIPNNPQQALDFNSRDRLTFGGHFCLVKFSRNGRILAAVLSEAPQEIRLIDPANCSGTRGSMSTTPASSALCRTACDSSVVATMM